MSNLKTDLFKGEARRLRLSLRDDYNEPFDLTLCTQILAIVTVGGQESDAKFSLNAGPDETFSQTLEVDEVKGDFILPVTETMSKALPSGSLGVQARFDFNDPDIGTVIRAYRLGQVKDTVLKTY